MENNELSNLNLKVYSSKLDNGLSIYVVPMNNRNNIYVTFSTKFGSRINEFVPLNENKMKEVPLGVAHFLEHKAFEQEDGVDPFTFFSERGASANANTSYNKTTYLFSGSDFFEENLNYLLDYVQKPYFTDENVEKEKGIIIEEYQMYQDNPYNRSYEILLKNTFVKDPIRYSVIGTKESIKSITKEDLYACYNTFYHPSNMMLVVTGNVNPEEVFDIVKKNQSKKEFCSYTVPKIKEYSEPKKVYKEYEEISMDVTIPKVSIGYKIDLKRFEKLDLLDIRTYLNLLFGNLFGNTSVLNEELKEKNIIYGDIILENISTDDYMLVIVAAESNKYKEFIDIISNEISKFDINEEALNRKKKAMFGSIVAMSDDIFSINGKIMSNIINYKRIIYNDCERINKFNMEDAKYVIANLDLKNKTICVVKPNK